jgi:hypothetical protein
VAGWKAVQEQVETALQEVRQRQQQAVKVIARATYLDKRTHELADKALKAIAHSRERLGYTPILQQQLEQADRHLREGAERIEKQRALIAELVADGHEQLAAEAQTLLRSLLQTQNLAEQGPTSDLAWDTRSFPK